MSISLELKHLSDSLEGTLLYDDLHKTLYATDAGIQNIAYSGSATKNKDIVTLVRFAEKHKISLIQELQVPHWQDKQWETVLL
jgi:hypothetical protein